MANTGPGDHDAKHHLSPRRHPQRLDDEAYRRKGVPVFFTLVAAKGRPFLLSGGVPELLVESIDWNAEPRGTCIICYCTMPDHVHLIARNGREDEDIRDFAKGVKLTIWRLFREAGLCRRAEDWPYSEYRGFYEPDDG